MKSTVYLMVLAGSGSMVLAGSGSAHLFVHLYFGCVVQGSRTILVAF